MRRGLLAALALAAMLGVAPGAALAASPYARVNQTYSTTGMISACQYSSATLQAALKSAPSFSAEYDADFTYAVQEAISARAGGACSGGDSKLHGLKLVLTDYGNPAPPSSVMTANEAGVPLPLVLLALLAASALLGAAVITGGRVLGFGPRWAEAADHALRETEFRLGGEWRKPRPKHAPPSGRPQLPPGRGDGELDRRPPPKRLGR